MTHVRIIVIENAAVRWLHSKYDRRLERVQQRLLPQMKSLDFAGVELFQAVTSHDFIREENVVTYKGFHFTVGTGCAGNFLSNFMLWQLCLSLDSSLLILEDDARLPDENVTNVLAAIRHYEEMPDTGDILYLLSECPWMQNGIKTFAQSEIASLSNGLLRLKCAGDLSGTAAYCIRPAAAKKLINHAIETGTCATDLFLHDFFNHRGIGVLVPENYNRCFMLDDAWAEWNHVHTPS